MTFIDGIMDNFTRSSFSIIVAYGLFNFFSQILHNIDNLKLFIPVKTDSELELN